MVKQSARPQTDYDKELRSMADKKPKKGFFDNLKQTFENFVDQDNLDQSIEQSGFFRAVRLGREEEVKKYLKEGQDINALGLNRQTALHAAISKNNLSMVTLLLKNGANAYAPADDTYGTTPLDKVISRGKTEMLAAMRKQGVDFNKVDSRGEAPLYKAIDQNKPDIVEYLLECGCDPMLRSAGKMSPVMLAIKRGYTEVVDVLLSHTSVQRHLNTPEIFGMEKSPVLHQMLEFGSEDIAWALVKHGAEVNAYDHEGRTPLHNAISKGAVKYVSLLAENGADMNSMPSRSEGYLPLHFACDPWRWKQVDTTEVLHVLLFAGADPNILNKKERATPLSILVRKDNVGDLEGAVDVLLEYGAVTNVYDKDGKTPLLYAMDLPRDKMTDVIGKMLEAGANPNLPEKTTGKTPLHYAVMRGDKWLVEKFMQYDGKAQQKDKSGQTPISIAQKQNPKPTHLLAALTGQTPVTDATIVRVKNQAPGRKKPPSGP